jgi:hypothetical protein
MDGREVDEDLMSDTQGVTTPPLEEKAPWIAQVPKEKRGEDLLSLGANLGEVVDKARAIIKERDTLKAASKPKEGVPDSPDGYKFTFAEDFPKDLVSEADIKQFASLAHELKLTGEEAAKIVNMETARAVAARKAFADGRIARQKQTRDELINEYKEKADERLAQGFTVVDKFGDPELKKELNETGMGDNPRLIKMLVKLGAFFTEKGLMGTASASAGAGAAAATGPDLKEVYKRSYATGAMK